jgi:hypothetical protein
MYKEMNLSPKDLALPDVSDYFSNSAGKFIDFMKLVGTAINARLYSSRTGTWLKTQTVVGMIGMEPCEVQGAPFKLGVKKSKKRSTKRSKKLKTRSEKRSKKSKTRSTKK